VTDRGTYIKMSDSLPEHRKIAAAGGDAAWLHICALAYCSRNRTDGLVPQGFVPRLSDRRQPMRLAAKLIEVDLWHGPGHECKKCPDCPAGEYLIHDYLEHQRSAARIAEVSERRASAGREGGRKSKPKPKQVASDLLDGGFTGAEANGNRSFTEGSLREPQAEEPLRGSQPDAVRPQAALVARADPDATAQTLIGEWIDHCRKRPPDRVIGQVGKELRLLLSEGHDVADVRAGLARWHSEAKHPSTLASFVNEAMNGSGGVDRKTAEDQARFQRQMARAAAREESQ
jgi:hypothetical protein